MESDDMHKEHPEWYHATDYKWLYEHRRPRVDTSRWNMMDDHNRRNVANWSGNDFTMEEHYDENGK